MIRKPFLLKLYDAANMQRWNDKIRPVELTELDKQAHKMIIAYMLARFEAGRNRKVDFLKIIEGGLFELLQRLTITDLKPPLFYKIKADKSNYKRLNRWVYDQIEQTISPLGEPFCKRFKDYLFSPEDDINRRILGAAHFYATKWEFDIIEWANPNGYDIQDIKVQLQEKQEGYNDLRGIQQLALFEKYRNFIDLCGEMRFQVRWSYTHRVPRTSVLGHMLIVAILSHLFSQQVKACKRRCINNYCTGLFHDLPEVLTRDIPDPVKTSFVGITDLIKQYEKEEMKERVTPLIPKDWRPEIKMFTEGEFKSIVTIDGKVVTKSSDEISRSYNKNVFNPRDGELVKAADELAAFIEAHIAIENGIHNEVFEKAKRTIREKNESKVISGIRLGEIYADFG